MDQERADRAKQFLHDVLPGGGGLESLSGDPVETIAVTEGVAPAESELTRRVAEKVVRDEPLDETESFALEAIIIPDKRPAIDVIGGDFTVAHPLWRHFETDARIKGRLKTALPSVGRVDLKTHPYLPYGGTAFVVGRDLLMTNRHVAEIFCAGLGVKKLVFSRGYGPAIDFKEELGGGSEEVEVTGVPMMHPYWDMALLKVKGLSAAHPPLTLALTDPDDLRGRDVAVIGYPAFDPRNNTAVQNTVFGGRYNIKRLQPGKMQRRSRVHSFGKDVAAATHDSSTLGGNSGSAVIDVASGHVVALHFAGVYLKANYAVPTRELSLDARVVDAGVNFARGGRPARRTPWDAWWRSADAREGLVGPGAEPTEDGDGAAAADGVDAAYGGGAVGDGADVARGEGGTTTLTIPLEISVTVRAGGEVRRIDLSGG